MLEFHGTMCDILIEGNLKTKHFYFTRLTLKGDETGAIEILGPETIRKLQRARCGISGPQKEWNRGTIQWLQHHLIIPGLIYLQDNKRVETHPNFCADLPCQRCQSKNSWNGPSPAVKVFGMVPPWRGGGLGDLETAYSRAPGKDDTL